MLRAAEIGRIRGISPSSDLPGAGQAWGRYGVAARSPSSGTTRTRERRAEGRHTAAPPPSKPSGGTLRDALDRDPHDVAVPVVHAGVDAAGNAQDAGVRADQAALRIAHERIPARGAGDVACELVVPLAARVVRHPEDGLAAPPEVERVEARECVVRVHEHGQDRETIVGALALDLVDGGTARPDRATGARLGAHDACDLRQRRLEHGVVGVLGDRRDAMARDRAVGPDVRLRRVHDQQRRR